MNSQPGGVSNVVDGDDVVVEHALVRPALRDYEGQALIRFYRYMESKLESVNDADKVMKALCQIGVVSGSIDDVQCKRKIIELGLTIPEGRNDCMLIGRESEDVFYTFVCFRDPRRSDADQGFIGLRFDCAKYRSNPLAAHCDLSEACALFTRAVAKLTGIDLNENAWGAGHRSYN